MKIFKNNVELIKDLKRFINDAEINLGCYEVIRNYIKKNFNNYRTKVIFCLRRENSYLLLLSRNHLFSSLLTLYSMLFGNKDEISPNNLKDLNIDSERDLNNIKTEFKSKNLHIFRHKFIAHTAKKDSIDTLICFETLDSIFTDINEVLQKLKDWLIKYFKEYNDYLLKDNYKDEILNIIKLVEKDYKKKLKIYMENQ